MPQEPCACRRGERLPWRPWQIVRFTAGYLSHGLGDLFFILLTIPLAALLAFLPRYRYRLVRGIVSGYLVLMFQRLLPALGVYRIDEVSGLDGPRARRPSSSSPTTAAGSTAPCC